MSEHDFVFVGGLHRSGTTLLARAIAKHDEVSGFRKTEALANEGQFLQSVYPIAREFGGTGRFGFDERSHMTEDHPLATEANRDKLTSRGFRTGKAAQKSAQPSTRSRWPCHCIRCVSSLGGDRANSSCYPRMSKARNRFATMPPTTVRELVEEVCSTPRAEAKNVVLHQENDGVHASIVGVRPLTARRGR